MGRAFGTMLCTDSDSLADSHCYTAGTARAAEATRALLARLSYGSGIGAALQVHRRVSLS